MPMRLTHPARLPLVAPSVLAADFADMGRQCHLAIEAGADTLHLDVMDGHFVPNLTMGPDLCACLRRALPDVHLDVHLMVTDPSRFVGPFAKAGANHLTFHIEAVGHAGVAPLVKTIRGLGCTAGLAINPPTHADAILGLIDVPDLVLVMSVNPGFAGQAFMPEVLNKTRICRERLRPEQRLQMDGGISPGTAAAVRAAGADNLVVGSALFGKPVETWGGIIATVRG